MSQAGPPLPEGVHACQPAELHPIMVDPDAVLEPGFALLRVHRQHTPAGDTFQIEGHSGEPASLLLGQHGRPRIALADLMRPTVEAPDQVRDRLRSWSSGQSDLVRWLQQLRRRHGDRLRLMIADNTGWGIPWELTWLSGGDGCPADAWLGAEVPVARWVAGESTAKPAAHCYGEVIAYLDPAMNRDSEVLARYCATPSHRIDDFMQRLEHPESDVGMVYVGAHGNADDQSGTSFTVAGISVFRLEVGAHRLTALRHSAAVVFLNACHSAREVSDARNNDHVIHSFASAFMRAGAQAFVGTSGAVGIDKGREAVRFLLERIEGGKLSLATALRDYRRHLARLEADLPLWGDQDRDVLLSFLYGFMYVYYGHPDTTLALVSPDSDT